MPQAARGPHRSRSRVRPNKTSLSQRTDLRTGHAVWAGRRLAPLPVKDLRRDVRTDALVVGAGISGALVADALTEAGLSVLIADRRGPLQGSTSASTCLLQYELDVPLNRLAARIGRVDAERMWRRTRLAVDALRERTRHLGIRAGIENRDALELEGTVLDEAELRIEAEARRRAGFEVTFLSRHAVRERYGVRGRAAIVGYDNCLADPRRLAAGFLHAALGRGAHIYAPVEVSDLCWQATSVVVQTKAGPIIRARHVVLATGYELPRIVPTRGHKIVSTWAIATKPQRHEPWPGRVLIWEASDPYLYLRPGPGNRVICGGEDESFKDEEKRDALLPEKTIVLERKLKTLFPHLNTRAAYAWAGSFGVSTTGVPSIGPIPGYPRCYAVLGYGGNGIVFSMMAAQMLRGLIVGIGDPDTDLVSFTRQR